jgi:hypothetical protein
MKRVLVALISLGLGISAIAAEDKKTTTTQQAADAAKRQQGTGTTNENAARQLRELERDEKRNALPCSGGFERDKNGECQLRR